MGPTGAGKTLLLELIAGFHFPDSGKIKIDGRHLLTLSGGEQQRVSLARALVTNPKILLLDEPLSALDSRTQESARELLSTIHKNKKLTVLHITHDQTEARIMADRIAIIMDGNLMQVGTPEEIFEKPADSRVASFVGFENMLSGRVISSDRGLLKIEAGKIVIDASGMLRLGARYMPSCDLRT